MQTDIKHGNSVNNGSLNQAVREVLETANANAKADKAGDVAKLWFSGSLRRNRVAPETWPDRPARPAQPELIEPRLMPRRRGGGLRGRVNLLHALAHIELNAIDLAFDLLGRFAHVDLPDSFIDDWMQVGADEARHFTMLENRLRALDSHYGALPAHDGLWEAAQNTATSLPARLAVVPMVLEARGLDVTPAMIAKLEKANDLQSARLLSVIYEDEKNHVGAGSKWFHHLCVQQNTDPAETFRMLVDTYFRGELKPPFNIDARNQAGMPENFYLPVASGTA